MCSVATYMMQSEPDVVCAVVLSTYIIHKTRLYIRWLKYGSTKNGRERVGSADALATASGGPVGSGLWMLYECGILYHCMSYPQQSGQEAGSQY